jgi:membrane protease YdiL (CAAX protease family)
MTRRSAAWFFLLAYALSWGWLIPVGLTGGVVTAGKGWPTHFPALLGPLLAASMLTAGRDGWRGVADLVRRIVRVRVPLRWWLFAISPLVLLVVVLVIDAAAGQPLPAYGDFAVFSGLPSRWGVVGVAVVIFLINGFGEETGWRGFALPALQRRHSPLVATMILSAFWAGWHAPMFFVVSNFRSFDAPILAGWIIGLFCGAVVLTWLYNRSGGSILLAAVWHATYNIISGTGAAKGLLAAASTTLVIVLALTLIGLELRANRHGGRTVLGPADPERGSG